MIWIAYIFSRYYSLEEFSRSFCMIMRFICVFSLICWLLRNKIISLNFIPEIINSTGQHFKFLFFTTVPTIPHLALRNQGPFWEPGTFQIYLFVALYFSLFIEKENNKILDSIIIVATMLSTMSGAALIPIFLIFAAYTFQEKNFKAFVLICIATTILVVVLQTGFFDQMLLKLTNSGETNSMTFRIIGIVGGLQAFMKNPLFGSSPALNNSIKVGLANQLLGSDYSSNANTFMNYLGYFGIFVGGYFWYRAIKLFKDNLNSLISIVFCFGAFIFSTCNENLTASLFMIVLLFLNPSDSQRYSGGENNDYCTN